MSCRPAYLVDVFEHFDGRLQRVLREEAETSREALATARIFIPASAGSIAYFAVVNGEEIVTISSLESHGEVPADYMADILRPWSGAA